MDDESKDFPAAHSMDTTWFGVDEEGELAVFESGEGGSVPNAYGGPPDSSAWWDVFNACPLDDKHIRRIPVEGAALAALCTPDALQKNLKAHKASNYSVNVVIRYADEASVIEGEPDGPGYWIEPLRFAGPDVLVLYPEGLRWEEVEKRIASGGVIGIAPPSDGLTMVDAEAEAQGLMRDQLIAAMPDYERKYRTKPDQYWPQKFLGFHFYGADDMSTIYDASRRPVKALKVTDLPLNEETKAGMVRVRGVRFAQAAAIQPLALMECGQWGDQWAAVDGSLHGRQDFRDGVLHDGKGEPYDREAMWRMGVRPIGALPVEIDYTPWREAEKAGVVPTMPAPRPATPSWLKWLGFGRRK